MHKEGLFWLHGVDERGWRKGYLEEADDAGVGGGEGGDGRGTEEKWIGCGQFAIVGVKWEDPCGVSGADTSSGGYCVSWLGFLGQGWARKALLLPHFLLWAASLLAVKAPGQEGKSHRSGGWCLAAPIFLCFEVNKLILIYFWKS